MFTVLFTSVLAVNNLNTNDNPWPRWHKPYVSTEVTNLSSQGVIRANMSVSMTAVVNIYSVCGGVETLRKGEEDKGRWHFHKSECVSWTALLVLSNQASNCACLLLHVLGLSAWKKDLCSPRSRSLKQRFVLMFLKENTLKKPLHGRWALRASPARVRMHVLHAPSLADYTYLKTICGMEQSGDLLISHHNWELIY